MKIPLLTLALMTVALAPACSTTQPSALNPDPVHGGPCHDGDQGCTPCRDPSGAPYQCPDMWQCEYPGCSRDDSQFGPDQVGNSMGAKLADAGAELTWCDRVQQARAEGSGGKLCPSRRGELVHVGHRWRCTCAGEAS